MKTITWECYFPLNDINLWARRLEEICLAPHGHFQAHPSQFSFTHSSSLETQAMSMPCCVCHPPTAHHCFHLLKFSRELIIFALPSLSSTLLMTSTSRWISLPTLCPSVPLFTHMQSFIPPLHPQATHLSWSDFWFCPLSISNLKLNDLKLLSVFVCCLSVHTLL